MQSFIQEQQKTDKNSALEPGLGRVLNSLTADIKKYERELDEAQFFYENADDAELRDKFAEKDLMDFNPAQLSKGIRVSNIVQNLIEFINNTEEDKDIIQAVKLIQNIPEDLNEDYIKKMVKFLKANSPDIEAKSVEAPGALLLTATITAEKVNDSTDINKGKISAEDLKNGKIQAFEYTCRQILEAPESGFLRVKQDDYDQTIRRKIQEFKDSPEKNLSDSPTKTFAKLNMDTQFTSIAAYFQIFAEQHKIIKARIKVLGQADPHLQNLISHAINSVNKGLEYYQQQDGRLHRHFMENKPELLEMVKESSIDAQPDSTSFAAVLLALNDLRNATNDKELKVEIKEHFSTLAKQDPISSEQEKQWIEKGISLLANNGPEVSQTARQTL